MEDFNLLYNYLGQQYLLYEREEFHRDELKQWINDPEALSRILDDFVEAGFLNTVDKKIYQTTPLIHERIHDMDEEVFRSGSIGGGEISIAQDRPIYTVLVHFETTRKILENSKITYRGTELFFDCHPNKGYYVKAYSKEEGGLLGNEETIYRYLSHACYHDDIPIYIKELHHAGHDITMRPVTITQPKGAPLKLSRLSDLDEKQAKALSFFRQYKNFSFIETAEARYYRLLSLIKIVEGVKPEGNGADVQALLQPYLARLEKEALTDIKRIEDAFHGYVGKELKSGKIEEIIWEYYRNGVGHWRKPDKPFLDPDIPDKHLATLIRILDQIIRLILVDEYGLRPFRVKR